MLRIASLLRLARYSVGRRSRRQWIRTHALSRVTGSS
jgi:hypothetical protein